MNKLFFLIVLFLVVAYSASAQGVVGIKTNLLYGACNFTPNLGVEVGLGKRTTINLTGSYNWFNLNGKKNDNKKAVHWLVQPEFRYFLCERFNGHFFGLHATMAHYNIGGYELPLLFGRGSKVFRHQGWAVGAGISYGYQLMLGRSWNMEFNVGLGYARFKYDQYDHQKCGDKVASGVVKNYFGPTKVGVSLIWVINNRKK